MPAIFERFRFYRFRLSDEPHGLKQRGAASRGHRLAEHFPDVAQQRREVPSFDIAAPKREISGREPGAYGSRGS